VLNPDGNLYVTYGDYPGPNGMNYGVVEKFNLSTNAWINVTPKLDFADGETTPRGGFCGISQDPARPGTVAVSTLDRWWPTDTVYITHDGGANWADLGAMTSAAGIHGSQGPNFYFSPSVFMPISPWLSFGNSAPGATAGFGWWMSALLIDPANPDHLIYATGASIFATDDVSAADSGQAPTWYVQALGVEETDVTALISPTAGAHAVSGVGDIGGFRHDDLSASPAGGMFGNPAFSTTDGLDWAGQNPLFLVRAGIANADSSSPCNYGAYSSDGGTAWKPFGACAAGGNNRNNVGPIAVDASGTMMMWTAPSGSAPQFSTDNGASWSAAGGPQGRSTAVADKVTPLEFYAFDGTSFYRTTAASGGRTFAKVNKTAFYGGAPATAPVANFARAGDLWLPLGNFGLYHSTDGGVDWTAVASVLEANMVSVGAANPRARNGVQAVYLYGVPAVNSPLALYRSDDNGASWVQINDTAHQYGYTNAIAADTRVYGRLFVGTGGRGVVYGEIPTEPLGGRAGPQ
jgi:oligoxyloglucan reducing-end-specific cellobiohydrolase